MVAVLPTPTPSIWFLSWFARSSQRSARAGVVASAASKIKNKRMELANRFFVIDHLKPIEPRERASRKLLVSAGRGGRSADFDVKPSAPYKCMVIITYRTVQTDARLRMGRCKQQRQSGQARYRFCHCPACLSGSAASDR